LTTISQAIGPTAVSTRHSPDLVFAMRVTGVRRRISAPAARAPLASA
jgi:hypothetical protein